MIFIAAIEILVCVGIMIYLLKQKPGEKFTAGQVIKFLGFGMLAVVFCLIISILGKFDMKMLGDMHPILKGFIGAFLLAAIFEEGMKYIFFRLALIKNKGVVTHLDVIIGAALVGIGFTILEDIEFAVDGAGNLIRALLPMHILFQLVMGYFYGKAKVTKKPIYHVLAIVAPIVLHAFYDFPMVCFRGILDSLGTTEITDKVLQASPYWGWVVPLIILLLLVFIAVFVALIVFLVKVRIWKKKDKLIEPIN